MIVARVCPLVVMFAAPATAMVINGGAESGDLTGWQYTTGVVATTGFQQQTGFVSPFAGNYFFSMAGSPGTDETLLQLGDFDTPKLGSVTLSDYIQTENSDHAIARLGLQDVNGQTVADLYSPPLQSPPLTWTPFQIQADVGVAVDSWWIEFYGQGAARERETNVYFDNISLEVVPEPTLTTSALIVALACRLGLRPTRRKR